MSYRFEKIIEKIRQQKQKYHAKVLSDSGIMAGFDRIDSTFDIFALYVWILSDYIKNLSASLGLAFDIDLSEFDNFYQYFEVELPSLEEVLQGIYIKFKKISLPEIGSIIKYIEDNFTEEAKNTFLRNRNEKAVYGESRYDYSYYDPINVRRFLATVLPRLVMEHFVPESQKKIVDNIRDQYNVHPDIAKYIYNRHKVVQGSLSQTMILGYGILGVSYLGKQTLEETEITIVNYDDIILNVKLRNLGHTHIGFILGLSVLGVDALVPPHGMYKKPEPQLPYIVDKLARNAINRYWATPLGIANYNKPEERRSYLRSERADQYASLQLIRYSIENIVENTLKGENLTEIELRQYKNACIQLVMGRYKRHKWGYKTFQEMSDEEYKQWWINYWSRQGLNTSLLEKLYQVIGKWARKWGQEKARLGELVSLKRKYQALWV